MYAHNQPPYPAYNHIHARSRCRAKMIARILTAAFAFIALAGGALRGNADTPEVSMMRIAFTGYTGRTEALRNFPVLVEFSDNVGGSDFTFNSMPFADPDAFDLRFQDESGLALDYEIDTYIPDERLLVWVKVPLLQPYGTSFITATWGDSSAASSPDSAGVWSEYAGVWHFNEETGSLLDSTANQIHGMRDKTVVASTGVVGYSQAYSDNGHVYVPHNSVLDFGSKFSVSGWFKYSDANNGSVWRRYFNKKGVYNANNGWEVEKPNSAHNVISPRGNNGSSGSVTMPQGMDFNNTPREWYHVTMQYLGANACEVFVNGVKAGNSNLGTGVATDNTADFRIGGYGLNVNENWLGNMDEVRIGSVIRSEDWLWAEFANQSAPANFVSYTVTDGSEALLLPIGTKNLSFTFIDIIGYSSGFESYPTNALLYYGVSDGADVPLNWTNATGAPISPVSFTIDAPGVFETKLTGLEEYETYYIRFALADEFGAPAVWSPASISFTTGDPACLLPSRGLTQITTSTGTYIANNERTDTTTVDKLFNFDMGWSQWETAENHGWAVYRFLNGDKWAITNYALGTGYNNRTQEQKIWQLEGSNDLIAKTLTIDDVLAAKWEVVHAWTNETPYPINNTWYDYPCAENQNAFNAYRLNVLTNGGAATLFVRGWDMRGDSGAAHINSANTLAFGHTNATYFATYAKFTADAFDCYFVLDTVDHGYDFDAWNAAGAAAQIEEPLDGIFTVSVFNLTPGTEYYARFVATSGVARAFSAPMKVKTFGEVIDLLPISALGIDTVTFNASMSLMYPPASLTVYWGEQDGMTSGDWGASHGSASVPFTTFIQNISATAGSLDQSTDYVFRFKADLAGGGEVWSDLGGFKTLGYLPKVYAVAATAVTPHLATANGWLDWPGEGFAEADIWFYWGGADEQGAPDTWSGAATVPTSLPPGTFDFPLTGLIPDTAYKYCFVASNTLAFAQTETIYFNTQKRVYLWNKTGGDTWANAAFWNYSDGSPAREFPDRQDDVADTTLTANAITIDREITLGELRTRGPVNPVADSGGKLVMNKNSGEALISANNITISMPLELKSDLVVSNSLTELHNTRTLAGLIDGAGKNIRLPTGSVSFNPPEDVTYTNSFNGFFAKSGPNKLTIQGDHVLDISLGWFDWRYCGVTWGTLVIDGGTLTITGTGNNFPFCGESNASNPAKITITPGPTLVIQNGCVVKSNGDVFIGNYYNAGPSVHYQCNTLAAAGNGTEWNFGGKKLSFESHCNLLSVADGAVFTNINNIALGDFIATSNMVEAATGGTIDVNGAIAVGNTADINSVGNAVRTSGGTVNCGSLTVAPGNGLAPVITAVNETGIINVAGTATFEEDSFVWPSCEMVNAPIGRYPILIAEEIEGGENIRIAPDIEDPQFWDVRVNSTTIWLSHVYPATLILVR